MPQGQDPIFLAPSLGPEARIYPRDAGKVCGPSLVDGATSVGITVSRVSGTGTVGSYQMQGAQVPEGPWTDVGSAVSSQGTTAEAGALTWSYVRIYMATAPQAGTVVRAAIKLNAPTGGN